MFRLLVASLWIVSILPPPANADQFAPELDGLFERLAAAESETAGRQLESMIWRHWLAFPDDSEAQYIFNDVVEAISFGQLKRGLEQADKVIESHPNFAEIWNKRATLYFIQGDYQRSVSDIIQTLALEPRHFGALSGLVQIFERQAQYQRALKVLAQLKAVVPQSPGLDDWEGRLREKLAESAT
ncbi:tetratricopeptide repeat protein [Litorivicinus lipolyticus]|uniref:Tetratricopeptide repeat protein n=1 Tax=Litorivicinus lipolyticus TaxID=418701 RepID=A0A5Q2QDM4_9GAMM|nr:tetratricopeptide repeat protein [Litorivicinus lipolyticus]QGG80097.1 tetratricopeptide repeat protein [Litorivicinus lipolyticus]